MTGHYQNAPRGFSKGFATLKPALIRLLQGFICLALHMFVAIGLGMSIYFCGQEEFLTYKTFFHRFFY